MTILTRNVPWQRRSDLAYRSFNLFAKTLFRILCRIDTAEIGNVPARGPLIMVSNHINFLEVPILFTFFQPRPVTGFVKSENWDRPFFRELFTLWGGISIRRGEADLEAFRLAEQALQEGMIVAISPEGTRTQGKLIKGKPGTVLLAVRSGAPLLPVVHWGGETFWDNLKQIRRTDFHIRVGKPFTINIQRNQLNREVREAAIDEIMYQMAALLPPEYRGEYADMSKATAHYLSFHDSPGAQPAPSA